MHLSEATTPNISHNIEHKPQHRNSRQLHLSEAELPGSTLLPLLLSSCEAAGVKLPMPGGDSGTCCSSGSCAVVRMNTPLAVLPGNPRTLRRRRLRYGRRDAPAHRMHSGQRPSTSKVRARRAQQRTLDGGGAMILTGPYRWRTVWKYSARCRGYLHTAATVDSHLVIGTDASGSPTLAGLQVFAKPWMPGARFACCLPLSGPSGSAAAATSCLGPAPGTGPASGLARPSEPATAAAVTCTCTWRTRVYASEWCLE